MKSLINCEELKQRRAVEIALPTTVAWKWVQFVTKLTLQLSNNMNLIADLNYLDI